MEHVKTHLGWDKVWAEYNKLISKVAWKLCKRFGRPYEELLSEAIWGVWSQLEKWDEKRGSLSTWIYRTAYYAALDYCIKPQKEVATDPTAEETPELNGIAKTSWTEGLLAELSEDAHILVQAVLQCPEELASILRPAAPVASRQALEAYMTDVHDWTNERLSYVMEEVRACL